MSIESAKAFYSKITTDEAFQTQLRNTSSEERTAVIRAAGYDFTPEEWEAATAQVLAAESADRELNDAELEVVAGGVGNSELFEFIKDLPSTVGAYGVGLPLDLNGPTKEPSVPPPP